jgi:hypothetical protein
MILHLEETMERRQFLAASIATSAAALSGNAAAQAPAPAAREYYQLRRYNLTSGPQLQLTENYLADAFIPAVGRMGMGPVGAFKLDIGQDTPAYYVLIPGPSAGALAEIELHLGKDENFLKVAAPFWNATSAAPAFLRVEISLLSAFEGWPRLTLPASSATGGKRIFQLRIYESPSNGDHARKVEMFHAGEFDIFRKVGFRPVFFGDSLVGPRLPNLTYMLSFENRAELEAKWDVFHDDPDWKKMGSDPRFAFDHIVTNISNLMLSPLACSQI